MCSSHISDVLQKHWRGAIQNGVRAENTGLGKSLADFVCYSRSAYYIFFPHLSKYQLSRLSFNPIRFIFSVRSFNTEMNIAVVALACQLVFYLYSVVCFHGNDMAMK